MEIVGVLPSDTNSGLQLGGALVMTKIVQYGTQCGTTWLAELKDTMVHTCWTTTQWLSDCSTPRLVRIVLALERPSLDICLTGPWW